MNKKLMLQPNEDSLEKLEKTILELLRFVMEDPKLETEKNKLVVSANEEGSLKEIQIQTYDNDRDYIICIFLLPKNCKDVIATAKKGFYDVIKEFEGYDKPIQFIVFYFFDTDPFEEDCPMYVERQYFRGGTPAQLKDKNFLNDPTNEYPVPDGPIQIYMNGKKGWKTDLGKLCRKLLDETKDLVNF